MDRVCRDFLKGKCTRTHCRFSHDSKNVATNDGQRPKHRRIKNTETFEPLTRPVDMRVVLDLGTEKLTTNLTSRDVVLVPNLFADFAPLELYDRLKYEIMTCGVPSDQLLKPWHGGTHLIADDHTSWKNNAPTFKMILDRIRSFFDMDIKATRFNLYEDTSQWKAFHHDAAALKPEKARVQNFTVAVSFGATRDAAFEEVTSKKIISMPQPDGTIYAFAKDTNILWKHGILQEKDIRYEGRISVIAWGYVDYDREKTSLSKADSSDARHALDA